MKLSREVHRELENFYRFYFRDDSLQLPNVEIFVRRGAWVFSKVFAVNGITIGKTVFIKPSLITRNAQNRLIIPKNLLVHELTHVIQYQRRGFFGFLIKYFGDYFKNLRSQKKWDFQSRMNAYMELPDEIEARDAADQFAVWSQKTAT